MALHLMVASNRGGRPQNPDANTNMAEICATEWNDDFSPGPVVKSLTPISVKAMVFRPNSAGNETLFRADTCSYMFVKRARLPIC